MIRKQPKFSQNRLGTSMIEVVISIGLVSVLMLVTMQASTTVLHLQQDSKDALVAAKLVDVFFTEITCRDFRDRVDPVFGLESGESVSNNRTSFDDIDDYHGQSFTSPIYRDSQTISEAVNWAVSVTIEPASSGGATVSIGAAKDAPLRRIQILCTSPRGQAFSEVCWISDVPSNIEPSASFQRMRTMTFGFSGGVNVRTDVPMRNMPEANLWE